MRRAPRFLAISDAYERSQRSLAGWLGELEAAGVDAVQIREKHLGDRALYDLAGAARRAWPGLLLLNGRLDVALAAGCDGVHLTSAGLPIEALRRCFGERIVIGVSTHRVEEVAAARRAGADYVSFGPVFPTPSKARYGRPPGLDGLRRAADTGLPVIALGGVGPSELGEVVRAGAAGVAGIRSFHDPGSLKRWAGVISRKERTWQSSD